MRRLDLHDGLHSGRKGKGRLLNKQKNITVIIVSVSITSCASSNHKTLKSLALFHLERSSSLSAPYDGKEHICRAHRNLDCLEAFWLHPEGQTMRQ